jgi:type IV pilus assembly protein PilW
MHNPLKNSRSGFTLIELLVAIAIAGIALGAIYSVFASAQKTSTSNEVTARVMQSLRISMDLMESDIRMAGLRGLIDISGVGIEEASAKKLRFTADRDMSGTIENADLSDGLQEKDLERITYFYDETDPANKKLTQCLSEGTTNDWVIVAENVDNFSFSFLDETNNVTADTTLIRTVEVSMTIKQPAGRAGYISRTITRRIFCRNLAM